MANCVPVKLTSLPCYEESDGSYNTEESSEEEVKETFEFGDECSGEDEKDVSFVARKKTKRKRESWVEVATGLTRHQCEAHYVFAHEHSRLYPVKSGGPGAKVSGCSIHDKCDHKVRMRLVQGSSSLYEIHSYGDHNTKDGFRVKAVGLNAAVHTMLDPLLSANMKPEVAANKLKEALCKVPGGEQLIAGLPAHNVLVSKITNRKRTLNRDTHGAKQTPHLLNLYLMDREVDFNVSSAEVKEAVQGIVNRDGNDALICCARLPLSSNSSLLRVYQHTGVPSVTDPNPNPNTDTNPNTGTTPNTDTNTNTDTNSNESVPNLDLQLAKSMMDGAADGDLGNNDDSSGHEEEQTEVLTVEKQAVKLLAAHLPTSTKDIAGYVFSSQHMLDNLQHALRDYPDGVPLSLDGTYKMVTNDWTLVVVGTHSVHRPTAASGKGCNFAHRFIPMVMALVSSESELSYRSVLGVLRAAAMKLFDQDLNVVSCCMDRSDSIKNACQSLFSCAIANCWPHLTRNALKMARTCGPKCVQYYEQVMQPQMLVMHEAPSQRVFDMLAKAALVEWEAAGQTKFAEWLRKYYLSNGWEGWRYGAAGLDGAVANNNTIESFNRDVKIFLPERATLLHFVQTAMPAFLKYCGEKRCPASITGDAKHKQYQLITSQPLPKDMIVKAAELAKGTVLTQLTSAGNTAYYMPSSSHPTSALTKKEVTNFNKATGSSSSGSFASLVRRYMCMHCVVRVSNPASGRDYYRCDCKQYVQSAYVCSHVLAVYDLVVTGFELSICIATFTAPRHGGRPTKRSKALEVEVVGGEKKAPSMRGANMIGASIQGTGQYEGLFEGIVGTYCRSKRTYTVSFIYSAEPTKVYTMSEEEVQEGYKKHQQSVNNARVSMCKK